MTVATFTPSPETLALVQRVRDLTVAERLAFREIWRDMQSRDPLLKKRVEPPSGHAAAHFEARSALIKAGLMEECDRLWDSICPPFFLTIREALMATMARHLISESAYSLLMHYWRKVVGDD